MGAERPVIDSPIPFLASRSELVGNVAQYVGGGLLPADGFVAPSKQIVAMRRLKTQNGAAQLQISGVMWNIQQAGADESRAGHGKRSKSEASRLWQKDGREQGRREQIRRRLGKHRKTERRSAQERIRPSQRPSEARGEIDRGAFQLHGVRQPYVLKSSKR